jgi:hypothetical protein
MTTPRFLGAPFALDHTQLHESLESLYLLAIHHVPSRNYRQLLPNLAKAVEVPLQEITLHPALLLSLQSQLLQ